MALSEEHRCKISEANRGQKRSEETKRKMREARKGRTYSEESRRKMSETHKKLPGHPHTEEEKRKISEANKRENREVPNKGWANHTISEEGKQRIRESKLGKKRAPFSEEWKRKISESQKGHMVSSETLQKRQATRAAHGAYETLRQSAYRMGKANQGRKPTEEVNQKRREASLQLASDPEHLAKISRGVLKAYENPEFRARNRQILDEARAKSVAAITGVPLSEERKARLSETSRKARLEYWKDKSYEERLAYMHTATVASENIRISSLELQVKKLLDAMGIQYEQQKQIGMYWVDFYLPAMNTIVEVYGCWWHGCEQCGKAYPKKNARDRSREAYIKACGYQLVILWEHDLVENMEWMQYNGNETDSATRTD